MLVGGAEKRPTGLDGCGTPGSPRDLVFQTKVEREEECVGDGLCLHTCTHGGLQLCMYMDLHMCFTYTHTYTILCLSVGLSNTLEQ